MRNSSLIGKRRMVLYASVVFSLCGALSPLFMPADAAPKDKPFPLTEARSIDGSGNNSNGGAAHTNFIRIAGADYPGDGSGSTIKVPPTLPNARDVSNLIAVQSTSVGNDRDMSDMVWAWGQFLDHDIDLTETSSSNGTASIPVLGGTDPLAPGPIPFSRSDFDGTTGTAGNPRQQINAITSFIDASNVYGSDAVHAAALREFTAGKLKKSSGNMLPFDADGFVAGDVRANEQVGLTALHTLFMREHNRLATQIAKEYKNATDEQIYQLARKIVGAEMQRITYNEFLPALLGPVAPSLDDYSGFNAAIDPSIANEFSTALFRFGHSMLSPQLLLADKQGVVGEVALRDAFFNPDFLAAEPSRVRDVINGLTLQPAQEIDNQLVDDVRDFLFGPPGAGGLDLASLNIQRGRDHGLPPYNAVRAAYGLAPAASFADISSDAGVQAALALLYDSVDDVDTWVGGLAEDRLPGASVGELVAVAIAEQFIRLRDGDRFFYLNDPDLAPENIGGIIDLDSLKLSDVIIWNTDIVKVQDNVFEVPL